VTASPAASAQGLVVRRYSDSDADAWDEFVGASKNGTFLFRRGYMDYHADRFTDASLMVVAAGEIVALLPANRTGADVVSHAGLTYGGLVLDARATVLGVAAMWSAIVERLRAEGVRSIVYKTVPAIYHRVPAQEDRHALFASGARLVRRDVLSAVSPATEWLMHPSKSRSTARAARHPGVEVGASGDWPAFWDMLERRLRERHGVAPVHALDEMTLLAGRFPSEIRLVTATVEGAVAAGAVLFESACVVHVQYMATDELARKIRLLDLVLRTAIEDARAKGKWFDLGASMHRDGTLNAGLARYKEQLGGRTAVHDVYALELS
jgi:GNAT acetyltransferase-like protein